MIISNNLILFVLIFKLNLVYLSIYFKLIFLNFFNALLKLVLLFFKIFFPLLYWLCHPLYFHIYFCFTFMRLCVYSFFWNVISTIFALYLSFFTVSILLLYMRIQSLLCFNLAWAKRTRPFEIFTYYQMAFVFVFRN